MRANSPPINGCCGQPPGDKRRNAINIDILRRIARRAHNDGGIGRVAFARRR